MIRLVQLHAPCGLADFYVLGDGGFRSTDKTTFGDALGVAAERVLTSGGRALVYQYGPQDLALAEISDDWVGSN